MARELGLKDKENLIKKESLELELNLQNTNLNIKNIKKSFFFNNNEYILKIIKKI